ncbi:SHOCT-like domain-containing protein [Fervidibacillus albus]|uniref:YvlB/LiaX N-terminal domain-containing protein n=1 Tax=Fervidibacillus albus TaxID=2980026 RepID=A0A9E8LUG3_9BACI|nr:hypothetical protein [Fervidibacillus albus]WAA09883.1 hypothetical protein OE104_00420 [Fervidibacillus albus]
MKNEIEKILNMVQEGKIDAEKASELIEALKEREEESNKIQTDVSSTDGKMVKIRIVENEGEKVSINLPFKLAKVLTKTGVNITSHIPDSNKYLKDFDMNLLADAIDNDLVGDIINIQTAEGDIVKISID